MHRAARSDRRRASFRFRLGFMASVAALFAAAMLGSTVTRATHVDPTQPATIVVGPSPGIAPMARVDAARRGRAHQPLPDRPKVVWRRAGRGGLDLSPLTVDARGAILVPSATLPELWQLLPDGAEAWRAPTGRGPVTTGSVILADGTEVVATSAGELLGFSGGGKLRFATPLDLAERNARIGLMPLDDGGVAIVSGHEVEEFDADGRVREEMRVPERTTGALVATLAGTVVTTAQGAVYLVKPGHVKSIGSFGGDPSESGASTADGRTLWAVVDHQRVVALDTSSGAAQVRFSVTDQSLHGPVVFGVLIMLAPNGDEMRRTVLEPRLLTLMTDAGRVDFAALEESPPPLTDEQGRTAFARVGGRIGVVGSDGNVNAVSGGACNSPAALAPAGPKRMVVGCRDGTVLLIGDDAP